MNRMVLGDLRVLFLDLVVEAIASFQDLLDPWRGFVLREVEVEFLDAVDHLTQHDFRITDHRQVRVDLPSDSRRGRIDLYVLGLVGPGRRLPEMLTAPEAEADCEHDVGAAGERLLEGAANRDRMLLGDCALAGTAGPNRRAWHNNTTPPHPAPPHHQNAPPPATP